MFVIRYERVKFNIVFTTVKSEEVHVKDHIEF